MNYLTEKLVLNKKHTCVVGPTGTGKSINISSFLGSLPENVSYVVISFSA